MTKNNPTITQINMSDYPRREHFEHFRSLEHPFYSITVTLDITVWLKYIREKGYPFFFSFLYTVGRAANAVPQLRQRIHGDSIVEYSNCEMSYTAALPDETYRYCNVDTSMPFSEFLPYARACHARALNSEHLADEGDINGLIFVSCIPWITFDSMQHIYLENDCAIPDIVWGKYHTEQTVSIKNGQPVANEVTLIPLSIQVHHAVVDGLHLSRFYTVLQDLLNSPDF